MFGPHNLSDAFGTGALPPFVPRQPLVTASCQSCNDAIHSYARAEDPRVVLDESTGVYYMMYTIWDGHCPTLGLATTTDPTSSASWVRHGPLGFGCNSKSGAMLVRQAGPHYLLWGAGQIRLTSSQDLTKCPSQLPALHFWCFPLPTLVSDGTQNVKH